MKFKPLPLVGAYEIVLTPICDERGFNARAWCANEFEDLGLCTKFVQTNVISNGPKGTLRGFHWQDQPVWEAKLFRVTRGAVYDAIIDLRPDSPTYKGWTSLELRPERFNMLYVPQGFAQAFQTLEDDTELNYQTSEYFAPDYGRGISYDDPAFGITWPLEPTVVSQRDLNWPDWMEDVA